MRQGFLKSSRYSPGNMDRDSLEALFVGRGEVMEDVLSRVNKSISSRRKHYILLVGPRGSGKTHFLSLAYHRLMDQLDIAKAQEGVAVALLNEEEWGVASYLDFVVRILRALADKAPGLDDEIAEIYDRFSKDQTDAESYALEVLRHQTRGKTLLLLCENLVDLFHGLNEEGQKRWRASIQEEGNWAIVATTPSLFDAVSLQDNPFHGFFTIRSLDKIDFDSGLELLAKKAAHEGKTELADFLRTPLGRARARAIHHLAAGNHRAYVVLFDFLDKESLKDLIDPFMHMVDDLTPYYQDKMRQLPPAQRKIVEFLCLRGTPTTIKDVSTHCLMSHQTAAKQIGELDKAGFVTRIPAGRNTFCELSEPLMRICIEVKDNNTQHFRLFVEFLRHWFTTRELERRHAALQHDEHTVDVDLVHVEEALRCSLADGDEPLVEALCTEAEKYRDAGDFSREAITWQTLARDGGSPNHHFMWVQALLSAGDIQSAIAAGQEATTNFPDNVKLQVRLTLCYFEADLVSEALSAINRAIRLHGEETALLCVRADIQLKLKQFEEALKDAQAVLGKDPGHWHSLEQMIHALEHLERTSEAESRVTDLVELAPLKPRALRTASRFYLSHGRLNEALELADRALGIDSEDELSRRLRGLVLFRMADYHSASEELRHFASNHPQSVSTHCRLADSLLLSGQLDEAVEIAEHLIEIDPAHSHAHCIRGRALLELGRPEDAIIALNELLLTDGTHSLLIAASLARDIGDYVSARRYLDRIAELEPKNQGLWIQRTRLHIDEDDSESAAKSAAKVLTLPGCFLVGRLLATQAAAVTVPLEAALDTLESILEGESLFERQTSAHQRHREDSDCLGAQFRS